MNQQFIRLGKRYFNVLQIDKIVVDKDGNVKIVSVGMGNYVDYKHNSPEAHAILNWLDEQARELL